MKFLIDIILFGIIVGFMVVGYRKGFVKTILSCLKNVIAFLVAFNFSSQLARWLKDQFFMEKAKDIIEKKVAEFLGTNSLAENDIVPLLDSKHEGFLDFIDKMGIDVDALRFAVQNTDTTVNDAISEYIATPCVNALSGVLAFIMLFVGTLLVIALLGFILGAFSKLPIIKGTNKLLGGILGLCFGVFASFVVASLIRIVIPYFSDTAVISSLEEGKTLYNFITSTTPTFLSGIISQI